MLLTLLFSCTDGTAKPQPPIDEDHDGFSADDDCDDSDATINPAASERCDAAEVDEDCDGVADDADADVVDPQTWYRDADGDGWGDAAMSVTACERPPGFAAVAEDCDDADAATHPGADETCEVGDEDCDGLFDDDDAPVDATSWYADADADGYGAIELVSCAAPEGFVATGGDCDDADALVHPAETEVCDPADADEDCDGLADDQDPDVTGLEEFYADADADGWGDAPVLGCSAPPGAGGVSGDCDDADPDVNPGAAEVCDDGLDNDCDGSPGVCGLTGVSGLAGATAKLIGEDGWDLLALYDGLASGDLDGDGLADLVVGSPTADGDTTFTGEVYVAAGPVAGTLSASVASFRVPGEAYGDLLGSSVAVLDADRDGLDDLAVGARGRSDEAADAGAAYVFHGPLGTTEWPATADASFSGDTDQLGMSLAAGDWDGDGAVELIAGSDGGIFVLETSGGDVADALATLVEDGVGSVSASGGDLDGDGLDELVAGDPWDDADGEDAGAVFVLEGGTLGAVVASDADRIGSAGAGARLGSSAAIDGDLDGDGHDDLLLGAEGSSNVYIYHGPLDVSAADVVIAGETSSDLAGSAVAWTGDISGDGQADLVVGASGEDSAGTDAGAVYVIFGPIAGSFGLADADGKRTGDSADDRAGNRVASAGDTDGDGDPDLLVAAPYDDDGGAGAGAVYLLLGGGL